MSCVRDEIETGESIEMATVRQQLADYALQTQARASALERWGKTLMMLYRRTRAGDSLEDLSSRCYGHAVTLHRVGMTEQARNARAFGDYCQKLAGKTSVADVVERFVRGERRAIERGISQQQTSLARRRRQRQHREEIPF